jgi:hypothetical protein
LLRKSWFEGKKKEKEDRKKRKPESDLTEEGDTKKQKQEVEHDKGTIVVVKNMGAGVTREIAKELFSAYGTVAYIDFQKDDTDGFVRMGSPEEAEKVVKEFDKEIQGNKPELSLLSGWFAHNEFCLCKFSHLAQDRKRKNTGKKLLLKKAKKASREARAKREEKERRILNARSRETKYFTRRFIVQSCKAIVHFCNEI